MIACALILGAAAYAKADKVVEGGFITMPRVEYPRHLEEDGVEGCTMVQVVVEANGRVSRVRVTRSSGHADLDKRAVHVVRKAAYRPTTVNGKPIRSIFYTSIVFVLDDWDGNEKNKKRNKERMPNVYAQYVKELAKLHRYRCDFYQLHIG